MIYLSGLRQARQNRPRLGQIIPREFVDDVARSIAEAAEPKLRKVVREERAKAAQALMSALPLGALSVLGFLATYYFVPDSKSSWKFGGYAASWLFGVAGAGIVFHKLSAVEGDESGSEARA